MELLISEIVELAKSGGELYAACVERGTNFKLIRNVKPTKVKLSFDYKMASLQKGTNFECPNGIDYVKFENLESKQNITYESVKNYGKKLKLFSDRESAVIYYNSEIDNVVISYNADIEYLKGLVANIKKVK
jgi:hypothetical protein